MLGKECIWFCGVGSFAKGLFVLFRFLSLFCLLLISSSCFSQGKKDTRERLHVYGYSSDFYVSKSENCYFVARDRKFYKTDLNSEVWRSVPIKGNLDHLEFKQICELQDSVIVVGCMNYSRNSETAIYRLNEDGSILESDSMGTHYIDELFSDEISKVWVADANQNLYYSADAGATWSEQTIFKNEYDKINQRITDLYFLEDGKTGWVSTTENSILKTTDNGENFQVIPTLQLPHDEKEQSNTKIRPVGRYYFSRQYDRVFFSDTSHVAWVEVDTLAWFDRSDDGGLLAITTNNNAVLFDANLRKRWSHAVPMEKWRINGRNNKIFFLTRNFDICVVSEEGVMRKEMFSGEKISYKEGIMRSQICQLKGREFFVDGVDVMCRDSKDTTWYRFVTMPDNIKNIWQDGESICVSDFNYNKYRVNCASGEVEPYVFDLSDLEKIEVKGFMLQRLYKGCMTSPFYAKAVYKRVGRMGFFQTKRENTLRDKSIIRRFPKSISDKGVECLWKAVIKGMKGENDTIPFSVSDKEKEEYGCFIEDFDPSIRPHERNFYASFVDSIDTIDSGTASYALSQEFGSVSTALSEKSFVFLLPHGELIVRNRDIEPNYMYTPWVAIYQGEEFPIKSLSVGILLDKITRGGFIEEPYNTKSFAIYSIARYYYYNRE